MVLGRSEEGMFVMHEARKAREEEQKRDIWGLKKSEYQIIKMGKEGRKK